MAKLAPVMGNLRDDMDHKASNMLPEILQKKTKDILKELTAIHAECSARMTQAAPDSLEWAVDDIQEKTKFGHPWEPLPKHV